MRPLVDKRLQGIFYWSWAALEVTRVLAMMFENREAYATAKGSQARGAFRRKAREYPAAALAPGGGPADAGEHSFNGDLAALGIVAAESLVGHPPGWQSSRQMPCRSPG